MSTNIATEIETVIISLVTEVLGVEIFGGQECCSLGD